MHHKRQFLKHFGVLMTNNTLFWSFYVSFCTFYASLRLKKTVFTRLLKKANNHSSIILNHLKGLHSFAFFFQSLIPRPQSLTPNLQSLTPNPLTNMMIQSKTNNHLSLILNHLYGLHNFAFYILIFDFSLQSLTPNPQPLTPDPWPLTPNAIVRKYLRAEKLLYNCREDSTTIESSLQINLFMQNKANFQKVKLNVNKVLTRGYDQLDTWSIRKTKPIQSQSKPIQSQLKPIKCQNKPNSNPIQTQLFALPSEEYHCSIEDLFGRLDLLDKDVAVFNGAGVLFAEVIAVNDDMLLKPDRCRIHVYHPVVKLEFVKNDLSIILG